MNKLTLTAGSTSWLKELKLKIRSAQIKAALAANTTLIEFYCDLGRIISEKDAVCSISILKFVPRQGTNHQHRRIPSLRGKRDSRGQLRRIILSASDIYSVENT